jgi:Exo-beta-D-glucosaminidase Ig-fold domain
MRQRQTQFRQEHHWQENTPLKVNRGQNGEEILPVLWEDNYVSLMPGEKLRSRQAIMPVLSVPRSPRSKLVAGTWSSHIER